MSGMSRYFVTLALTLVLGLSACSADLPKDPDGTLDRITDGVVVVGITENPPHTQISDDGGFAGSEVDIVTAWADGLDAEIEWVPGAEAVLMEQLKQGDLDVVIGGLTSNTPWSTHAALTRPYAETVRPDGKETDLVLAARMGENALLVNLEQFLIDEGLEP